jgi:hypothetical protein
LRTGKGLLPMLFTPPRLRASAAGDHERKIFRALSNKQSGKRQARADRIKALRDAQLKGLAVAFDIQKAVLDQKHEQEIAAQKQGLRDLAKQRKELWDEWRKGFAVKPRQTTRAGSGGEARSASPPRPRSSSFLAPESLSRAGGAERSRFAHQKFEPAASKDGPQRKAGWKQRRSAAERKADGSYKPRQRTFPCPDRSACRARLTAARGSAPTSCQ